MKIKLTGAGWAGITGPTEDDVIVDALTPEEVADSMANGYDPASEGIKDFAWVYVDESDRLTVWPWLVNLDDEYDKWGGVIV